MIDIRAVDDVDEDWQKDLTGWVIKISPQGVNTTVHQMSGGLRPDSGLSGRMNDRGEPEWSDHVNKSTQLNSTGLVGFVSMMCCSMLTNANKSRVFC